MTGPSVDTTQQAALLKITLRSGLLHAAETAGPAQFPGKPEALFRQPQDWEEGHTAARVNRAFPHRGKTVRKK